MPELNSGTSKSKKKSKRMTCSKRYKILKKVREHHRKSRKELKKAGNKTKHKKDPGIPNAFPFKEQVLKQLEQRKQRAEDEKQRKKELRQKEINKRRKLETLQKDAEKRAKEFEKKQRQKEKDMEDSEMTINVENSRKAYYKEFKKVVDNADVVIEVLDARDPMGCRCPQLEEAVMAAGLNKRLVLLLNKIDLVSKDVVEKWLKYLRNEFPALAFKASTQTQKQKLGQSKIPTNLASKDLLSTSKCIGASTLLTLLGNYCRNKNLKTAITVGVVGFPNVGKSSVINSLKRCKACNVGSTPGVTRNMQEVQLDKHVKLLDSPGIVMATTSTDTQIILRNCVKVEQLDDPAVPVGAILRRCNKHQIMEKYCVPDYKDTQEFLSQLGKRLGKLKKGGIPDINAAAKAVLQDWNSGKISFFTYPPERTSNAEHESASVVQYWGAEFDMKALEREEQEDFKGLLDAMENALVIDPGKPGEMDTEKSEDEDENEKEEDMDSDEADDEDDDDGEGMEDDEDEQVRQKDIQVQIQAKKSNKTEIVLSKEKEMVDVNELNLWTNKTKKKAFKKKQKEHRKKIEKLLASGADPSDAMVDSSEDDTYNFSTDFT